MYPVDVGQAQLMIINIEGKFHAVDRICTHETADLSTGFLTDSEVTCPLHLLRFDINTGKLLNPPAIMPLRTYKVKIDDANVYVQI